jgi:MYXO-CTERM domain-containing protein
MHRTIPALVIGLAVVSSSGAAAAHISLTSPAARYDQEMQKDYPCGALGNPAGANPPTMLAAGDTITVTWDEFIDHDSHFRISLSAAGDDAFVNPTSFEDFYNSPTVLLDQIADEPGVEFHEAEITLPDMDCNPCTLQLMQVMYSASFSEGSLYYQCADIVIGPAGASTSGGVDDTGASGSTGDVGDSSSSGDVPDPTDASASATAASDASASATASATASASDGGTTAPDTDASSSGTSPADQDDAGGCGCRTDARGSGWLALVVLGAITRRRRR